MGNERKTIKALEVQTCLDLVAAQMRRMYGLILGIMEVLCRMLLAADCIGATLLQERCLPRGVTSMGFLMSINA